MEAKGGFDYFGGQMGVRRRDCIEVKRARASKVTD